MSPSPIFIRKKEGKQSNGHIFPHVEVVSTLFGPFVRWTPMGSELCFELGARKCFQAWCSLAPQFN